MAIQASVITEHQVVVRRKSASKTSALDMKRANFRLLRAILSKVPWENAFAEPRSISADHFSNITT